MTRRKRDALPPPEDFQAAIAAADRYRDHFGEAPNVWSNMAQ